MIVALIISFLLSLSIAPFFIKYIKIMQFGQSIREEGPKSHLKKSGTPTLGGIIFLIPIFILSFVFIELSYQLLILLILTIGFGFIGFLDDFIKIKLKRNLGLTAKQKIFFQFSLTVIVYFILLANNFDTHIYIPNTNLSFDLGISYILFFLFFTIGTTNATNLTDGLDGLLSGTSAIAIFFYGLIAYFTGQTESLLFASIVIGSLFGFLIFNFNPAKVFMGDTGSLALGGALVGLAILTKMELLLAIIGFVFVIETLSVIIQVISYKTRKKRVFKMTPIHHHFEESGWAEKKVVYFFWFIGLSVGIFGLLLGV